MQCFIGLTKSAIEWANSTIIVLAELGIDTLAEAEKVLTESEFRRLSLHVRIRDNPGMNLWLQHPSTL